MPFSFSEQRPDVSVIIPVFNKLDLTRACIDSLHEHGATATFEILVVDNGSSDGSGEWLAEQVEQKCLRLVPNQENLGFSRGCNLGAMAARGRYLLFLNNDMTVTPGWLEPMVTTLDQDPQVGIAGAKLLFPDGTIQHGGVAVVDYCDGEPTLGGNHLSYRQPADDAAASKPQQLQAVTGACLMIRRDVYEQVGGFDEEYWNGNEDVDLCLKAVEAGWKVVYRPEGVVIHYESQSGEERWNQVMPNIRRFQEIWRGRARPDFIKNPDQSFTATPENRIGPYVAPRIRFIPPPVAADPRPRASVVVLTWNALQYTRLCAESLLEHTDSRHELIFVDNGSRPETVAYLNDLQAAHRRVRVILNEQNLGFAAGNNVGIAAAEGEYVCLLNSDTVVTAGWLERLIKRAEDDPRVGLVGPVTNSITGGQKLEKVAYKQDSLEGLDQFAAWVAGEVADRTQPALWVVGFCVLIRKNLIERIGGLDESFGRGNYEDTDYCLRAFLAGYHSVVACDCFIHHFGSRSFQAGKVDYGRELDEKFEVFRKKWNLEQDARETGKMPLELLVAEGFVPGLHYCPLPTSPHIQVNALPDWEAERWLDRGEAYFQTNRLQEAERMFRSVLLMRPDHIRAGNDLACTIWQTDRSEPGLDEATRILQSILRREPANEDAIWNLREINKDLVEI